ncbi:MAG: PEGA domain-containing protein [Methanoregula sp.]
MRKNSTEKRRVIAKFTLLLCLAACMLVAVIPVVSAVNQGWIQIISNVDGASVYFDDRYQGQTSDGQLTVTVYMAAPVHFYLVKKPGFTNATGALVMPEAGATTSVLAIIRPVPTPTLPPSSVNGSLSVDTSPRGAQIYIDGNYRGISKSTFGQISPGSHTVDAVLEGYYTYTTMIWIEAGITKDIRITLEERPSLPNILSITSDPTGAFVYIDSVYGGKTPLTFNNLLAGIHEIRVITPGYEQWTAAINFPSTGSTQLINVPLIPLPPSDSTIPLPGTTTLVSTLPEPAPVSPTPTATKAGTAPAAVIGALGIIGCAAGIMQRKK